MDNPWVYGEPLGSRPEAERLRVVRCPPTGHADYLLLGEQLFIVRTHYDEVSIPCEKFACLYCAERGWPSRLEGYVAAVQMSPREKVVLAVSEFVCYQIAKIAEECQGLRGQVIRLRRGARRPNAPIYAAWERDERHMLSKPPPDIHPVLARLWGRTNLAGVSTGEVVLDALGPHGAQARRQKREGESARWTGEIRTL